MDADIKMTVFQSECCDDSKYLGFYERKEPTFLTWLWHAARHINAESEIQEFYHVSASERFFIQVRVFIVMVRDSQSVLEKIFSRKTVHKIVLKISKMLCESRL
jgi:hypothetical protein